MGPVGPRRSLTTVPDHGAVPQPLNDRRAHSLLLNACPSGTPSAPGSLRFVAWPSPCTGGNRCARANPSAMAPGPARERGVHSPARHGGVRKPDTSGVRSLQAEPSGWQAPVLVQLGDSFPAAPWTSANRGGTTTRAPAESGDRQRPRRARATRGWAAGGLSRARGCCGKASARARGHCATRRAGGRAGQHRDGILTARVSGTARSVQQRARRPRWRGSATDVTALNGAGWFGQRGTGARQLRGPALFDSALSLRATMGTCAGWPSDRNNIGAQEQRNGRCGSAPKRTSRPWRSQNSKAWTTPAVSLVNLASSPASLGVSPLNNNTG
jgi:hypothetical protein